MRVGTRGRLIVPAIVLFVSSSAAAQQQPDPHGAEAGSMEMPMHMDMSMPPGGWHLMQDGVLFGMYNRQDGPSGGEEFRAPNWWMMMLSRSVGGSQLSLNAMVSLDRATMDGRGYRELFQVGETAGGQPLVNRRHPHDFFMQLAAVWRIPIGARTGLTFAGGPSGEPAIGPVAFMHRASAAENPLAPLSHHTFDSTHISFGVVTAAVDHGPLAVEVSAFNGREPDEQRWNFDFGPLDSMSGRIWLRPTDRWEFQVSSAHLKSPEALEPGDITRSTASATWLKAKGDDFGALTLAYGLNTAHQMKRHALLIEGTRHRGRTSVFTRVEGLHVETSLLIGKAAADEPDGARRDPVGALTVGGVYDVVSFGGFKAGLGASATGYAVPRALIASHGARPVSFQVFLRLRPPAGSMGRMWNMRMARPMAPPTDPHAGHHMMN